MPPFRIEPSTYCLKHGKRLDLLFIEAYVKAVR